MKQDDLINRLREELTHIGVQTEGNSAMGLTDHNKIAENLICGLMREILSFRGLRNLNATEHANCPAIDLADFGARIAVQVTATATLPKIKGTIGKFLTHGLHGSFDRLVVYVLARKQDSYSQEAIDKDASPKLTFDGPAQARQTGVLPGVIPPFAAGVPVYIACVPSPSVSFRQQCLTLIARCGTDCR